VFAFHCENTTVLVNKRGRLGDPRLSVRAFGLAGLIVLAASKHLKQQVCSSVTNEMPDRECSPERTDRECDDVLPGQACRTPQDERGAVAEW
jgi:hypothetical protein